MLEIDVYEPLSNWFTTKYELEWHQITHENPCIIFNHDDEKAEVDICFGNKKAKNLILTDAIHVKTKSNLRTKQERFELLGKAGITLAGINRVWIAIEKSTLNSFKDGINEKLGIITYEEEKGKAIRFTIKKEPENNTKPVFERDTQTLFNKKFQKITYLTQNFFLCSLNADNWKICMDYKLWGVPDNSHAARSALRRAKPGDLIVFRLNGVDFIALWMIISSSFEDSKGGPWKIHNHLEKRNFSLQIKIHPLLGRMFENRVKLSYPKGINNETGFTTKMYLSGMVQISENQYKTIARKLIDANLKQLENSVMINYNRDKWNAGKIHINSE